MDKGKKQENCFLCKKKLNFWFTSLKKYKGNKVCSNCAMKIAKKELDESISTIKVQQKKNRLNKEPHKIENFATKLNKLGVKLTIGLTIPIILFFLGLFTFPFGILFWILGFVIFAGTFSKN